MLAKSLDVFVLLKLCVTPRGKAYAALAAELGMSASEVHAAVQRLMDSGLVDPETRLPRRGPALEYLVHGVRYAFPARRGTLTQGLPTSHAAPPLNVEFPVEDVPPVWPDPEGSVRGYTLEPLHPSAPQASRNDSRMYALLALVDAIRDGGEAERQRAVEELRKRLNAGIATSAAVRTRAKQKVKPAEPESVEQTAPEPDSVLPPELL